MRVTVLPQKSNPFITVLQKKKLQRKILIIMTKCKGPLGTDFQTCSVLLLTETKFKNSVAQNN